VTVAEFAEMFSLHKLTAERRLKALAGASKATVTKKRVKFPNGRVMACAAYRLTRGA
jgi:hypothetical protein